MMSERQIPEEWVKKTLRRPDYSEEKEDGTAHYIRAIPEHGGRFLRVIANPIDLRVVTLFFKLKIVAEKILTTSKKSLTKRCT
jgi:hypothetical protein